MAAMNAAPAWRESRPQTLFMWRTTVVSWATHPNPQISVKKMETVARDDFISLRSTMCGSRVTRGCLDSRDCPSLLFPSLSFSSISALMRPSPSAVGESFLGTQIADWGSDEENRSAVTGAVTPGNVTLNSFFLSPVAIAIGSIPHFIASCRSMRSSRAKRSAPVTMMPKMNGALNPQRWYKVPATGGATRLPTVTPTEAIPN